MGGQRRMDNHLGRNVNGCVETSMGQSYDHKVNIDENPQKTCQK
jgi:hypothetical protein